jgi:hypothetical protein
MMPSSGMASCVRDTDGNRCDDGVLCNGREVCLAGACRPDSSMLCPAGYTCDPGLDACCRRDAAGMNVCLTPDCGACTLLCSGLGCPGGAGCGCRADGTCGCLPATT